MRDVRKITTDDVRNNYLPPRTELDDASTEFDLWLVTERNRVAQMAIEKERKRIIEKLDNYTMYRFEKQWVIDLIEEDD